MAAVTIHSDLGAQENKVCHCFQCFPIYLPWSDGLVAMILAFWMLSFKPVSSLSSFTFINELFSFSPLFAIRVVSSANWRLLIFLPAILIPACDSPSLVFCVMYSAYNLNKESSNIYPDILLSNFEPVHCSMSGSNYCFSTSIHVSQEAGKVVTRFKKLHAGNYRVFRFTGSFLFSFWSSLLLFPIHDFSLTHLDDSSQSS